MARTCKAHATHAPPSPEAHAKDLLHPDRTNAKGHAVTASGANHNGGSHMDNDTLCTCGYPEGTFACKIRHVQLNTGDAKAEND